MDLLEHAAGVWAHRLVVLAVGLVAAASVFVWRDAVPDTFVAESTAQVRLPDAVSGDPSVQVGFYAETVAGLAGSRAVLERALELADRQEDPDALVDEVTAETGTRPGFVTVSATGPTGETAAALADAVATALSEQVADEQAADADERRGGITAAIARVGEKRREVLDDPVALAALEREREALLAAARSAAEVVPWRLSVVDAADVPDEPAAPNPTRDALLALIIALLLAAEGVVLVRAFRGSLSVRDPARDAGDAAGVPGILVGPKDGPTAVATALPVIGMSRSVTLVQRGPVAHARTATLLARLLAARGDDVLLVDVAPRRASVHREIGVRQSPGLTDLDAALGARSLDDLPHVGGVRVLPAGKAPASLSSGGSGDGSTGGSLELVTRVLGSAPQERLVVAASVRDIDDLIGVSAALDGPTVLEVDAGTTRAQVRDDAAALRGLGLDVVAVSVRQDATFGRRGPRPPAAN